MFERESPVVFTKEFFDELQVKAKQSARLRTSFDLRNTPEDNSQRILNVLEKGTAVPVHCHPDTSEAVVIVRGIIDWIFYDENSKETARYRLDSQKGPYGILIPAGQLHSIEVIEPSVIFEAKDGKYIPGR